MDSRAKFIRLRRIFTLSVGSHASPTVPCVTFYARFRRIFAPVRNLLRSRAFPSAPIALFPVRAFYRPRRPALSRPRVFPSAPILLFPVRAFYRPRRSRSFPSVRFTVRADPALYRPRVLPSAPLGQGLKDRLSSAIIGAKNSRTESELYTITPELRIMLFFLRGTVYDNISNVRSCRNRRNSSEHGTAIRKIGTATEARTERLSGIHGLSRRAMSFDSDCVSGRTLAKRIAEENRLHAESFRPRRVRRRTVTDRRISESARTGTPQRRRGDRDRNAAFILRTAAARNARRLFVLCSACDTHTAKCSFYKEKPTLR